ncbi:MAG: hypothetical protein ABGW69_02165 [Nanoarchaeota archaeon]
MANEILKELEQLKRWCNSKKLIKAEINIIKEPFKMICKYSLLDRDLGNELSIPENIKIGWQYFRDLIEKGFKPILENKKYYKYWKESDNVIDVVIKKTS